MAAPARLPETATRVSAGNTHGFRTFPMDELKELIRTIPDFPKPGIQFRDLTTLFLHPEGLRRAVSAMADAYRGEPIDMVLGIEARGFILGAPIALELGTGFVPLRKAGKLPGVPPFLMTNRKRVE